MTDTTTPAVEQTAPAHETPTTEADTANNQPTGEKAKLREQVDNLNKALKEARAETAKYRAAEEEKNRKEAEAKGEYEKVSQADQAKIAELTANVESLSGKSSAYEAIIQKQVDASVSTMSDAQKSIYEQLSVHLDLTGKLELIPKILEVAK
jgi:chromosome segregation ATPase